MRYLAFSAGCLLICAALTGVVVACTAPPADAVEPRRTPSSRFSLVETIGYCELYEVEPSTGAPTRNVLICGRGNATNATVLD